MLFIIPSDNKILSYNSTSDINFNIGWKDTFCDLFNFLSIIIHVNVNTYRCKGLNQKVSCQNKLPDCCPNLSQSNDLTNYILEG